MNPWDLNKNNNPWKSQETTLMKNYQIMKISQFLSKGNFSWNEGT